MAHSVVAEGAGRGADADLTHVLTIQKHEVAGLARDTAIDRRAAGAATGTYRVPSDNG